MDDVADKELRIWHVHYDGAEPVEVIAKDEWDALDKTQPRDADGHRTWRHASAYDITPVVPDFCTLTDN
jgi:hypothetical protein